MKKNLKQEIKYDVHVMFIDGRCLYLSDFIDDIVEYLKNWSDEIDYCVLKSRILK